MRVSTFCEGFCLSRDRYRRLVINHPTFRRYLEGIARKRIRSTQATYKADMEDDLEEPPPEDTAQGTR